ncbi:MAG TPA: glycosyltransferase family 2 protein [Dehalococcoidia bacterium]|nr:glycosyltransferase family 2 protein [Dehalococcoidia bacterium]
MLVSFNARDHLRRCLQTVSEHMEGEYEVIVVDNASPDASAEMVAGEFPYVRLLRNSRNEGFAIGANAGMRGAAGDVIVLLNPDCELTHDPFSSPADYLRNNPDVGALGIKILDPDGGLQLSVRRFPTLWAALFNRYSLLTRLWPRNPYSLRYLMSDWDHNAVSDVDWLSGACVMTTRAVLDRVGYLDEAYFWGFEDVDFCQRLHRAGLRVVYYPETNIVHAIGASARTVPAKALIARHRGMARYYQSYLGSVLVIDALVYAGIWARCGLMLAVSWLNGASRSRRPAGPRQAASQ